MTITHKLKLAVLGTTMIGLCACTTMGGVPSVSKQGDKSFRVATALGDFYDFALVQTDGGNTPPRAVSLDQAADILSAYDVVFIGEAHGHPGNHLAQFEIYKRLYERDPNLSLSLEQFETDVQPVLDDFMAGKIGESTLRAEGRAWDNYLTSYRPLVEFSKERGLPVIAAEAPTWIVVCVGKKGPEILDKLPPEQRPWVAAELDLSDGAYKSKYMGFVMGSGSHGKSTHGIDNSSGPNAAALRSYAGQVTRDETMAESIYEHLKDNPGRKVVHLDGSFHSESFLGTVERLQRRMPELKIAVVNPVQMDDPAAPSFTAEDAKTGTLLLLTYPTPPEYFSDKEQLEQIRKVMAKRSSNTCPL